MAGLSGYGQSPVAQRRLAVFETGDGAKRKGRGGDIVSVGRALRDEQLVDDSQSRKAGSRRRADRRNRLRRGRIALQFQRIAGDARRKEIGARNRRCDIDRAQQQSLGRGGHMCLQRFPIAGFAGLARKIERPVGQGRLAVVQIGDGVEGKFHERVEVGRRAARKGNLARRYGPCADQRITRGDRGCVANNVEPARHGRRSQDVGLGERRGDLDFAQRHALRR